MPKCESAAQCGDVSKHQEEKDEIRTAAELVNKLEKEIKGRQAIIDYKRRERDSMECSFDQKIRTYLINTNKDKYLFKTSKNIYVPRTAVLQVDIAILEKFYKKKIPTDLKNQAKLFQNIISNFNSKAQPKNCLMLSGNTCKMQAFVFPTTTAGNSQQQMVEIQDPNSSKTVRYILQLVEESDPSAQSTSQAEAFHVPFKKRKHMEHTESESD